MGATTPAARDWVLHVDLDQFLAAVEVRRRPELAGRPVVVGATDDLSRRRAVVATASYEARTFGIHSGMSLRTARRRCPDAVFLPSDRAAYEQASEQVMATLRRFPVVVQVLGWDEAFVGVTTDAPEALAAEIQAAIASCCGLSCAVGIGDTTLRAKVATGFAKPGGVYRLTAETWMPVMGQRPTDALWGIGARTARKLAELGIDTVAQLATADPEVLAERFGRTMGPYHQRLARGDSARRVSADPWIARSRSHQHTFDIDLTDRGEIEAQVTAFARQLAEEARAEGREVARVGVVVRFAPFFTHTRSTTLPAPTTDAGDIVAAARAVLDRFELDRPVRLVGARVEFTDA